MGYSLGCAVSIRAVTRHPARISALVLVAGFAHADGRLRLALNVWETLAKGDDERLLGQFLVMAGFSPSFLADRSLDELEEMVRLSVVTAPPGTASHIELARTLDVTEDISRLDLPVLVIGTTRDELVAVEPRNRTSRGDPRRTAGRVRLRARRHARAR